MSGDTFDVTTEIGLADSANTNTICLVKFEFLIKDKNF